MENDKPKSAFATWFKPKKSGCCSVKIEEIKDDEEQEGGSGSKAKGVPSGDAKGKSKPCC